jgi:glycopeptide antibiotics resistance protein
LLQDFVINVLGFVPLGYLLLSTIEDRSMRPAALAVTTVGLAISLYIEVAQYLFVSGRYPSTLDRASNIFGTARDVGV